MKPLRILAIDGPGDVLGTFASWCEGKSDRRVTHVAFSGQFFDICREFGAQALVLTSRVEPGESSAHGITVRNAGDPLVNLRGAAYHLKHVSMAMNVAREARKIDANYVLLGPVPYPFLVRMMLPPTTTIAYVLHGVLWPKHSARKLSSRMLDVFYAPFLRKGCDAILCVSEEIRRQMEEIAGPDHAPFVDFLPSFDAETFASITPVAIGQTPRVMFAGRVEHNKGVFDLLEMCRRLNASGRAIEFDLCGSGSALEQLRQRTQELGLSHLFHLHGWCDQAQMAENLSRSTVVIVPTTKEFTEGFNMVVVEALLAGRPVITSDVCPALEYVREAALEVPADNVDAYYDALVSLIDDPELYQRLQSKCAVVAKRFLDPDNGFANALRHLFKAFNLGTRPTPLRRLPSSV